MQQLLEVLGAVVLTLLGFVILYYFFQVIKNLADWYIGTKLVELYDQKDRLWGGVNDAYDNYEELRERTWDYDIQKKELRELRKDFQDLEEYILGGVETKNETASPFEGTWVDYQDDELILDFFKHKSGLVYLKVVSLPDDDNMNLVGSIVTLSEDFLGSNYYKKGK